MSNDILLKQIKCEHEFYEIGEQQGFVVIRCVDCGYEKLRSEIKKGKPKEYKKLSIWAPWRLFRRKK